MSGIKFTLTRLRALLEHPPSLDCVSYNDEKLGIVTNFDRDTYLMSRSKWAEACLSLVSEIEEFMTKDDPMSQITNESEKDGV